jgi:hypothetical protein
MDLAFAVGNAGASTDLGLARTLTGRGEAKSPWVLVCYWFILQ